MAIVSKVDPLFLIRSVTNKLKDRANKYEKQSENVTL